MSIISEQRKDITLVTINRPDVRNAVDRRTAERLADAFRAFDADVSQSVAVLTGAGKTFCAGAASRCCRMQYRQPAGGL